MMNHIGNFQLLKKKEELLRRRIASFKTTSILTLISSYLHGRIINSTKYISSLCCRREFDNLHGKKKLAALSQLKRSCFYKRTMRAFGIDQFVLVLNICL